MAEESDLEKTESASPRRLEQAREEGNVPQSRELQTFLVLIGGVLGLWVTGNWILEHMRRGMQAGLTLDRRSVFDPAAMTDMLSRLAEEGLLAIAPLLLVLVIAAFAGPLTLGGLNFSTKPLTIDLTKLSPISGMKRIFSWHGAVELIKGLLKSVLIAGVGIWVIWIYRHDLIGLMHMPFSSAMVSFGDILLFATLFVVSSVAIIAAIDVPFQLWHYHHELKMSKEDVKQEAKESEGDPHVKGQIRARQREMARRRMMEAVPKADVVVTNPTHYAVALKYEAGAMGAPKVVAKGVDMVAQKIRELAREHSVPQLEAPPLARALYRHAEIGDQIPAALYTAVAEVMAYVYQLNHFLAEGGLPPQPPSELPVPAALDPLAVAREVN